MYLFILETIGTQELILVGLVALIVFGPRKLPQLARKAGKVITEFRKVSNDFRSTWEREVAFEEEKSQTIGSVPQIKQAGSGTVPADESPKAIEPDTGAELPSIRDVDADDFRELVEEEKKIEEDTAETDDPATDKRSWL